MTISGAGGRLDVIDEIDPPAAAAAARRWIEPFLNSFGDVAMRIDELVAENDRVAARFRCSGTHLGTWLGHAPSGRRFTNVAQVYCFKFTGDRISRAWGREDTAGRLRRLGLTSGEGLR